MDHFLNLIFLGNGVTIRTNIGKKASWCKGNGMIMNTTGRREALGSGKDQLMFRKNGLEVLRYRGSLYCLCGMELGDNNRMTLFEQIFMRWELMISGEPTVIPWNIY
jgi:GH43 family beta-xylosidase